MNRSTHHDGDLVVFLIGMRVGRWWAVHAWSPVFTAMPRMLRELWTDHNSGLRGYRLTLAAGGPIVVQYWRSVDDLLRYAHDPAAEHRPAWKAFDAGAHRSGGAVGVWHETYVVRAGAHEPAPRSRYT